MISFENVCFHYENGTEKNCLQNINLTIQDGELILLCGESGCGKTTLTRLVNGLIPHFYTGNLSGQILVNGNDPSSTALYESAETVGSVFQNPRSQFFNVDTSSELVFGGENMGLAQAEIRRRLLQVTHDLNLHHLLDRSIFALSGGQKQKIACGSVAALEPEVIVLDEPSSNLDTASIRELAALLALWKSQGKTIVIAEHRLHYLSELADRIVLMDNGSIKKVFSRSIFSKLRNPELAQLGLRIINLNQLNPNACVTPKIKDTSPPLVIKNFNYAYSYCQLSLDIKHAKLPQKSIVAVIGHNGSGKTTFARCLCGLLKKCPGLLEIGDRSLPPKQRLKNCFMVMQDVNHQLFTESVLDELLISMETPDNNEAQRILESLNLSAFKDLHPMSLSGGQKQRVAIACAVASQRPIILFDEPTSGLDLVHMQQVAQNLQHLSELGKTQFVITHDPELILSACSHVMHLKDGQLFDQYPINQNSVSKILNFFTNETQPLSAERAV
ncbi:MAG: ABC transporter ATP-binding protein [Eubacteriaceae bacterium]|jgi:energy-coupling factor transport system ATP-binding protein